MVRTVARLAASLVISLVMLCLVSIAALAVADATTELPVPTTTTIPPTWEECDNPALQLECW